jgi:lysyl-tRNA synthetase class 2
MAADVDRFRRAEHRTSGAPPVGKHLTGGRWAVTGQRDPFAGTRGIRPPRSLERLGAETRSDESARLVRQLQRAASQVPAWAARLVFLLGLLNIASGLLHRHRRFEDLTQDFLPPFGAASVAVVGIGVGFGMLVMARGLRQRKQRAWTVVVALLCAAATLHLVRGTEPVQVVVSALVVVALLVSRRQFVGVADPRSRRSLPVVLAALVAGAWATGVLAILGEPRDLVRPWTIPEVLRQALMGLVGLPGPLRFSPAASATESRVVLLELGLLVAVTITAAFLRSSGRAETSSPEDRERLRALLRRHGQADSLGYFATRDDKTYVFSPSGKAAIAYAVVSGVCLASGDPIGDVEAWTGAIAAWLRLATERAWMPAVLGASERGAEVYRRIGFDALEIGDEAVVEVDEFTLEGRSMRTVRQAVNRGRRAGYQVSVDRIGDLSEGRLHDLRQETDQWRTSGGNERGFSMALSRFAAPIDRDCLIVQTRSAAGNLAVVLQLVPWGDDGLSLDLVRRRPQLENGVMELSIAELLKVAASRGITRVSLNFAMFRSSLARGERIGAGPFLRAWVRLLLVLSRWWQIASLYRANAKFRPRWEPRFLCFALARDLGPIAWAALQAEGFLPSSHRRTVVSARPVPRPKGRAQ